MLYCEERYWRPVTEALERAGLFRMAYRFDRGGAQVLMNALARPMLGATLTTGEAEHPYA